MFHTPRTAAEAAKITYGRIDSLRRGNKYNPNHCAYEVSEPPWYIDSHQCSRKSGHGSGQLYCKQHAAIVERREGKE
jgi:hypothetical protein